MTDKKDNKLIIIAGDSCQKIRIVANKIRKTHPELAKALDEIDRNLTSTILELFEEPESEEQLKIKNYKYIKRW